MTPAEKRAQLQDLRAKIGQIMVGGARPPKFTKAQRQLVLEKYEGHCAHCRDELQPGWPIDHIKPWADGGLHTLSNWCALCVPCHLVKTGAENRARAKPNRLREIEINGREPCKDWQSRSLQSAGFRPDPRPKGQKFGRQIPGRQS